ncbi:hypothetical protein C1645_825612 [Glomus cerebriforme]|uniref:Uncharacterized protein n=1 Tax=Glomus cerebriforme TaxID=658196 RepID=A0A397SW82_9GLOM|nr:hypothetical protein C1645_825612 [Glomus cerebriforme]
MKKAETNFNLDIRRSSITLHSLPVLKAYAYVTKELCKDSHSFHTNIITVPANENNDKCEILIIKTESIAKLTGNYVNISVVLKLSNEEFNGYKSNIQDLVEISASSSKTAEDLSNNKSDNNDNQSIRNTDINNMDYERSIDNEEEY